MTENETMNVRPGSEVHTCEELLAGPEEYRIAVEKIVISHAVNEYYGAQVFDEPAVALAPSPYAKWLTCRVAMEEYGHHVRFSELGRAMKIDPERMTTRHKRPLSIFEYDLQSWTEFCVIKILADTAEVIQVEDLIRCTFIPLRKLARMTMPEEKFHVQFGLDFTEEILQQDRGAPTVQDVVNRYYPMMRRFFGRANSENNRIYRKWGIKQRTNEAMAEDYANRINEIIVGKFGLSLPTLASAAQSSARENVETRSRYA